jgi:hypothetical protein
MSGEETGSADRAVSAVIRNLSKAFGRGPIFGPEVSNWFRQRAILDNEWGSHASVVLTAGMLSFCGDARVLVQAPDLLDKFSLLNKYGASIDPLFNLNSSSSLGVVEQLRRLLSNRRGTLANKLPELREILAVVYESKMLGRNTAAKFSFIQQYFQYPFRLMSRRFLCDQILSSAENLLEPLKTFELSSLDSITMGLAGGLRCLLYRQLRRLGEGHSKAKLVQATIKCLESLFPRSDLVRHRIDSIINSDPRRALGYHSLCLDYADDVLQIIYDEDPEGFRELPGTWIVVKRRGIEARFVERNLEFLQIGDRYGDCTASIARKQTDRRIKNIHPTVYCWLLDPHYRVLEVLSEGEGVLKAHILPLEIAEQLVLVVDAIEVVPEIRGKGIVDRSPGRRCSMQSERLLSQTDKLLECLSETVIKIAQGMGVGAVLVDAYSNAEWVRQWVGELESCCYRVSEVSKPFGYECQKSLWEKWSGYACQTRFSMEIQALNLALIDHGLRDGYKVGGLLWGHMDTNRLAVRGP